MEKSKLEEDLKLTLNELELALTNPDVRFMISLLLRKWPIESQKPNIIHQKRKRQRKLSDHALLYLAN
jgi:hypothetical protein